MKTIIIGNGILALTTAFRLCQRLKANDQIIIINDKSRRGSASIVAPAMLNSFAELEVDTLASEAGKYRFELSIEATKIWPKFIKEILEYAEPFSKKICGPFNGPQEGSWFDVGTYVINNTATDDLDDDNFQAILNGLKKFNEPHSFVSPKDIPNYIPQQQYRSVQAVYIKNEGWFNPNLLISVLEYIFEHHPQIQVINQSAKKLIQNENYVTEVLLDNGQYLEGDQFLVACGAATTDLIGASNLSIQMQRIFYGIGVTLQLFSPDYVHKKCIRTPNRGLACGVYAAPYYLGPNVDNRHLAVGASNFVSPIPCYQARLTSVSILMKAVIEQINSYFYKAELVKVNVGSRPLSQDGFPLLGKTAIDNLFIASGTRREGIHLAPAISKRMDQLMSGENVEEKFSIFKPDRPLLHIRTRKEAINMTVKHLMNTAYQHGFSPSVASMTTLLQDKYRDDLEKLHDRVGALDWGIPTDMIDMYRYGHALNLESCQSVLA